MQGDGPAVLSTAARGRPRAPESGPVLTLHRLSRSAATQGVCEHLSQVPLLWPHPSRAPTSLWVKAQVFSESPKVLHDLPHPLPGLPSSLSPAGSLCSSHTGLLAVPPALQDWSCPRDFARAVPSASKLFHQKATWLPLSPPLGFCSNVCGETLIFILIKNCKPCPILRV